jgi:predicted MFS family arabinose efflux permease
VNSADALIAARAAMGVGAAVIFPTTLSLITNIFADPIKRAKAIGLWAAMVGVGVAAGPITGGWLLEHFWWGSIFMVNVPVAVVAIVGGVLFIPTSRDPAAPRVDVPGLFLSAIGITALVYTVIEAPTWGGGSGRTAAGFALAIVVLAGFGMWEWRSSHPMLDVSVFANRRFSGGSLAVTAGFLTLFGFIFVITQYFQFIKSYSAFETGVRLLPVAASIVVGSVLGPRLVEKIGTTAVVASGLAIFAAGLAWASTADAATPYLEIAAQMVLLGGGLGLTTGPASAPQLTTPPESSGARSASRSWAACSRRCTPAGWSANRRWRRCLPMRVRPWARRWLRRSASSRSCHPSGFPMSGRLSNRHSSTACGWGRWSAPGSRWQRLSSLRSCCRPGRAKQSPPQRKSSRTNRRRSAHELHRDVEQRPR